MNNLRSMRITLLFALVVLAAACVRVPAVVAGTDFMAVPLEGTLVAEPIEVAPGGVTEVILTVVPSEPLSHVTLGIRVPPGAERLSGDVSKTFSNVEAKTSIRLRVRLLINRPGPMQVVASATLIDSPDFQLSKAFVVELNPSERREPAVREGTDAEGTKLRIQTVPAN